MRKLNIINNLLRETPFSEEEPFIEVDDETYQKIIFGDLILKDGVLVPNVSKSVTKEIEELKETLQKYKEDVEQVELFGMKRSDYEEKKQACANIIVRLRELEAQIQE